MQQEAFSYYIFNKPFNCLSQFSREVPSHVTLGDFCKGLPKNVFPVGRLDKDSEGLLLLTNDASVNNRLLHPKFQHSKTYLAQVEGIPTEEALKKLRRGVEIKLKKKKHRTLPAMVEALEISPSVPERNPPIRFRKTVPDSWLRLTLTEGKNRQVRKMCAAVGFPVLRLIRNKIENLSIEGIKPGELREIEKKVFFEKLHL